MEYEIIKKAPTVGNKALAPGKIVASEKQIEEKIINPNLTLLE